jgi:hypothetical protein
MPKIKFQEPQSFDYLYVDEKNRVHLLLPLVGGDEVASDNTCKTGIELHTFFFGNPNALAQLQTYQKALEQDINAIQEQRELQPGAYSALMNDKKERLRQIKQYAELIENLTKRPDIIKDLTSTSFPTIPSGAHKLLKEATNAFSIRLSTLYQDTYLRFESPLFSLERGEEWRHSQQGLGHQLRTTLLEATVNKKSSREEVITTVLETMKNAAPIKFDDPVETQAANFNLWKNALEKELQKINPGVSLALSNYQDQPLTYDLIKSFLMPDETTTVQQWIETIITSALTDNFWPSDNLFYEKSGPLKILVAGEAIKKQSEVEKMSIKVQFFMAEIAIFCKVNKISTKNFAEFLDKEEHSVAIAKLVMKGLGEGNPIEPILFKYINDHQTELGMSHPLNDDEQTEIKEKFNQHFFIIKDSDHFDEFFMLDPAQKGNVFTHKGRISCHFLDFYARQTGMDLDKLSSSIGMEGYTSSLQSEITSNRLNHKNPVIEKGHETIEEFNQEVLNILKQSPETLVAYLLIKSPAGVFNFELLQRNTCNAIVYNGHFSEFMQQINASPALNKNERQQLLRLLNRQELERSNRAEAAWSNHANKSLLDIELTTAVKSQQSTLDSYTTKRSISWWKGSPKVARVRQLRELADVKEEMQKISADPSEILDKLLKSIEVLDKIDREISGEWNIFQSTLQLEVRALRSQLKELYQLETAVFQKGKTTQDIIALEINHSLQAIANPLIRDTVSKMPAHCQTKNAIAFFNQLTPEEANKLAGYLNLEYYQFNGNEDKDNLFNEIIPQAFKAFNAPVLATFESSMNTENYEQLTELSTQIRPEIFTADNVLTWGLNLHALQIPIVGDILLDAMRIDAILTRKPQQFSVDEIQQMIELAQRMRMMHMENSAEMKKLPDQAQDFLKNFETRLHAVHLEPETQGTGKGIKDKLREMTQKEDGEPNLRPKA